MQTAHRKSYTAFFLLVAVAVNVLSLEWIEIDGFIYGDRLPAQYPTEWVNLHVQAASNDVRVVAVWYGKAEANPLEAVSAFFHTQKNGLHTICLARCQKPQKRINYGRSSVNLTSLSNIPHQNTAEEEPDSSLVNVA
jgi:hypothetical protein